MFKLSDVITCWERKLSWLTIKFVKKISLEAILQCCLNILWSWPLVKLLARVKNGSGETLFRWLINLYTSIRFPLCLWQYKEYKLRCYDLASYGKCANSGTNLVALCCICCSLLMFLAKYEFQIEAQYSKCGRMYVLYSIGWGKIFFTMGGRRGRKGGREKGKRRKNVIPQSELPSYILFTVKLKGP